MATRNLIKRIRLGVVGVGNWANYGHLRVLALLPQYEVVALQARRPAAAQTAAGKFNIPHVSDSVADLVVRPDVDMVAVLTTAPQHEESVRAAIAAAKHVYCEWPLTLNSKIARELVILANKAGVRHIVGLQRRLAPVTRYVHDLIQDGFVGRLRSVRLHVSMNYFQALRGAALRWTIPPENGSGVVDIYAGHFLDMLFAMVGNPVRVSALMANQFPQVTIKETGEVFNTTTPDVLVVAGTLENGAVLSVHIEGGKRNGSGVQIDLTGDAGDIRITNSSAFGDIGDDYVVTGAHGDKLPLETQSVPDSYNWVPAAPLPSAVLELAHLYAALAKDFDANTHTVPTFEDAARLHRLIEGFQDSSADGMRISVA
jgi:predicted dehydrogenase